MINSHLVWIPSRQIFLRFKELTWEQQKALVKVAEEEDLDFIFHMNELIKANCMEPVSLSDLTTIDRFSIFLYLKIHSCGTDLHISTKCPKCEETSKIVMDLNILMENVAEKIDKKFEKKIVGEGVSAICDIPSLEQEYKMYYHNNLYNLNTEDFNIRYSNYISSHIKKLIIKNNVIDMETMDIGDRINIVHGLPGAFTNKIYRNFLQAIHKSMVDIDFLKVECTGCKHSFEFNFDVVGINDIIKIIYKDASLESLIMDMCGISQSLHLGGEIFKSLTSLEIDIMKKYLRSSESSSDSKIPKEFDTFDAYREQTKHMQESGGEFS